MSLTFQQLAEANDARALQWRRPGQPPMSLAFALMELAGETGEACNEGKKLERFQHAMPGGKSDPADLVMELADVVICADLVARKLGIDLGAAVAAKFNATSRKHGFTITLPEPTTSAEAALSAPAPQKGQEHER